MEETAIGLTECKSSNIKAYGWDGVDLLVEYLGGARYRYKSVPSEIYRGLMEAESKGSYINSTIKNKFEYEKIK